MRDLTANDRAAARLAFGRILRLASRPMQPGDVEEYERCRWLILNLLGDPPAGWDVRPSWVRDRLKGAQGD